MKTFTIKARNEEFITLQSDDTYTLAINAPGSVIETTPEILFACFNSVAMGSLVAQLSSHSQEEEKLLAAFSFGDLGYKAQAEVATLAIALAPRSEREFLATSTGGFWEAA